MNLSRLEAKLDGMGLLVSKLEEWAETQPDKTFLYYGEEDRHYSYREINELANSLAYGLKSNGIRKGDRISLFIKNPLATVLSMFSIWKLGAIFCPINFGYKGQLLAYHINDTEPVLLVTEVGCEPLLNEISEQIACRKLLVYEPVEHDLDNGSQADGEQLCDLYETISFRKLLEDKHGNPGVELYPWDTANIVYTSGTTGSPKGVVQSHRWMQSYCYYGVQLLHPDDVVYCDLPLYHVGGAFSLVGRAAWSGCSVSLWDRFSASRFWERIHKSGATYTLLLDVVMPRLLQFPEHADDRNNTLRRVHMQPLPEYHSEFAKRFGIDFVNVGYGATEIGYASAGLIDETECGGGTPDAFRKGYSNEELLEIAGNLDLPVVSGAKSIPKGYMGKPCMFHKFSIMDKHDGEVSANTYGQIALRSRLPFVLLNEYLKKPSETAEAFRNLWFHTGDGAYKDNEGALYFVDRIGGFIRVRGENVSSSQVEDMLNSHQHVRLSAVFPVPADEGLEDDIVAYVVPLDDVVLEVSELRKWVEINLPKHMQPKHLFIVDTLPETPTHKIEKYKLKQLFLRENKAT